MKKVIKLMICGGYFGFALGVFVQTHFSMWQFWAILVPTMLLAYWALNTN